MAEINNCLLPDDLQYHVEFNVWLRDNGDGTFDMGMTDIAQTMAGSVIHCRTKSAGKNVKKGKSVATVESGKWVGPVKTPLTAEIMACNEKVESDATILNKSPYKDASLYGLLFRIVASDSTFSLQAMISAVKGVFTGPTHLPLSTVATLFPFLTFLPADFVRQCITEPAIVWAMSVIPISKVPSPLSRSQTLNST